jgi:HPt (histidine-containing phosphotransfer) domain-containing protein
VQKFIVRFLKDDSYPQLQQALDEEDYETAFRAAHTLKGVCQNLGITVLFESSSALTEALRHRTLDNVDELMKKVSDDYGCTAAAIETFKTTNGL